MLDGPEGVLISSWLCCLLALGVWPTPRKTEQEEALGT